jgi:hypothetical protein
MNKTLDEIRKKLQALDTRKGGATYGSGDKTVYPHWNIPEGTSTTLRFLPDANQDNIFFWSERQMIKLEFPGIKGQDENKLVTIQVPCVEMWDGKNTCPILNEVRPMWRDKSLEATARKYWVKKTYYSQGFVKNDPMNESEPPENPIRKFVIGPQIYAIIKAQLMDPEMEYSPVDYINGIDFVVSKTSKGGYSDYGTSKWARKESSLTEDMSAAISTHGLVDLASYLPKRPTPEQMAIMFDMFQASLEGELYDPAAWAKHFKPYGFDSATTPDDGDESKPASRPVARTVPVRTAPVAALAVTEDEDPPFEPDAPEVDKTPATKVEAEPASTSAGKSPQEILAMLRNRNK